MWLLSVMIEALLSPLTFHLFIEYLNKKIRGPVPDRSLTTAVKERN